jgi:hypothetical protein
VSFIAADAPANAALYIKNYGSGMCAGVRGFESHDNGAAIVQQPCNGSYTQRWIPLGFDSDYRRFMNADSGGRCLDVRDGVNADWTPVQLWACTVTPGMYWKVPAGGLPAIVPAQLKSAIGGRCLDVRGGSLQEGAVIQIYHCTLNNPAQAWTLTANY